jgi:hypothetical protein
MGLSCWTDLARALDEKMEPLGELTEPCTRRTLPSAPAILPATGCHTGAVADLSVVIPVYNEAAAIVETIANLSKLPKCDLRALEDLSTTRKWFPRSNLKEYLGVD